MGLSIRKYKKNECITFKSTKGEFGSLSNMAPNFPIYIHSTPIKTSEALYQALRFPDHPLIQKKIIIYNSPISAKKYSRTHIEKTRNDWEIVRFKIMRFCLQVKLFQNEEIFSKELLKTNDFSIVEFTDSDKVWGATFEEDYYIGTNALGRLLMELRENVKYNSFKLEIPQIDNFKLFGKEITLNSINPVPNNLYK